jgi:hydroxyethylthiazole kinase-like uncharacterized protein yjeF
MNSRALDRTTLEDHPLPPVVDGAKDTKGTILVIAGSHDVPGAALLSAMAAMRAGAGKLKIATTRSAAEGLGLAMPEAMVIGLAEDEDGALTDEAVSRLDELAEEADAIVAGPGMKGSSSCSRLAKCLLSKDAALALDVALLHALEPLKEPRSTRPILLPNADELASLLDCDPGEVDEDPLECGIRAAERFGSIVLVKGVTSHVVTPRRQAFTYEGGAPGLGVSGSGDVLAGIVGGLLARGAEPLSALLWAVWLHGQAGARLAARIGPIGFLAREIAGEIPALMRG